MGRSSLCLPSGAGCRWRGAPGRQPCGASCCLRAGSAELLSGRPEAPVGAGWCSLHGLLLCFAAWACCGVGASWSAAVWGLVLLWGGGLIFLLAAWTLHEAAASLSSSCFRAWGVLVVVPCRVRRCVAVASLPACRGVAWVPCCCCLCLVALCCRPPQSLVGGSLPAPHGCCSSFVRGSGLSPGPLWVCLCRPGFAGACPRLRGAGAWLGVLPRLCPGFVCAVPACGGFLV